MAARHVGDLERRGRLSEVEGASESRVARFQGCGSISP